MQSRTSRIIQTAEFRASVVGASVPASPSGANEITRSVQSVPRPTRQSSPSVAISNKAISQSLSKTILAVDSSLRGTGYAILRHENGKTRVLAYDVIKNHPKISQEACLVAIHDTLAACITKFSPEEFAIESAIFVQSYETAIVLGTASGVAILAAARAGLPVHRYAPRRVKQAVVGRGGAQKQQVSFMVRVMLGLTETPPPDAADAIAVGITHLQTRM